MGEVYRAYDTSHDRVVALKLLAPHLSDDENYRARFRRECHLAARLREPHVIPIHRYGDIDGRLFLDMRLVEGRDLGSVLADGPMPPELAVDIVSQVARALDAAHDDGLIHRDVKPSNVLIAEGSVDKGSDFVFVYLVDFGVARSVDENQASNLTQAGGAVGTFDYMPPERFAGAPADRRTDVYSLACLLHECLTATRPFSGHDLPALMYAHMNRPIPRPSELVAGVPRSLDEVVARGMAKDPEQRFARAGDLAAAARAALKLIGTTQVIAPAATNIEPLPPPHPSTPSGPLPTVWPQPAPPSTPPPTPPPPAWGQPPPQPAYGVAPGWAPPPVVPEPWLLQSNLPPNPPPRRPTGPTPPQRPGRSRLPWIIGGVAAALLVVLVIAVISQQSGTPTASPTRTSPPPTSRATSQSPTKITSFPSTTALTAGEQTLIADLPSTYSESNCKAGQTVGRATAAMACTTS